MPQTRIKTTASLAIIAVCVVILALALNPRPPAPDLRPHEALGRGVAAQALKLASGGKIILVALDTKTTPNTCAQAEFDAFMSELKGAHVSLAQTQLVQLTRLALVRVPAGLFFDVLRKTSEKDVVVSLLGPPLLSAEQLTKLPQKTARVVAVCSGETPKQIPMKTLFDRGMLDEAIICRPGARLGMQNPAGNLFTELFTVVTAANLQDLPAPAKSSF